MAQFDMPDLARIEYQLQRYLSQIAPRKIGRTALNHFDDSFRNEGFTDSSLSKWAARKPNMLKPETKKEKRILVQTGTLRRSLRLIATDKSVIISTDVPYAEIHNEGGLIIQKPTWKQRMFFSHISDTAFKSGNNALGNRYAAMSRAKELHIPIPKRQFIGNSHILNVKIEDILNTDIENIFQNKPYN